MVLIIVLLLSCVTLFGAETGIQAITTVRTNKSGTLDTREVFKREGQTNLVRTTTTKAGIVQFRVQRFYHRGSPIADYVSKPDSSGFTTEESCPYSVTLQLGPSNEVSSLVFGTNGMTVDAFLATNGVFYPADSSLIQRANEVDGDLAKLLSPSHITNTSPAEFGREVERFLQQHKEK